MSSPPTILILGAGIGGLSLAHGLRLAGLPFHIYERDAASSSRPQGYRFRIHAHGAYALHTLLPPSLFTRFEAVSAPVPPAMARLEPATGRPPLTPPAHRPPPPAPAPEGFRAYNADRTAFRELLLRAIGPDNVSFGKRCSAVEERPDGVLLRFADGACAQGAMLVGADGVASFVRRECLPRSAAPVDTDARCVYGKTPFTPQLREEMVQDMAAKTVMVQDRSGPKVLTLFSDPMVWGRERVDGSVEEPADYLYWVLGANREVFAPRTDEELLALDGEGAKALSLELTSSWHPSVRAALELQDARQSSVLRMMTAVPARLSWEPRARVTLLGDAAHVMPPAGGNGANTAIQDAALLVKILRERMEAGEIDVKEVIREYEAEMLEHARTTVKASAGGGKWIFDQKPFEEE